MTNRDEEGPPGALARPPGPDNDGATPSAAASSDPRTGRRPRWAAASTALLVVAAALNLAVTDWSDPEGRVIGIVVVGCAVIALIGQILIWRERHRERAPRTPR